MQRTLSLNVTLSRPYLIGIWRRTRREYFNHWTHLTHLDVSWNWINMRHIIYEIFQTYKQTFEKQGHNIEYLSYICSKLNQPRLQCQWKHWYNYLRHICQVIALKQLTSPASPSVYTGMIYIHMLGLTKKSVRNYDTCIYLFNVSSWSMKNWGLIQYKMPSYQYR